MQDFTAATFNIRHGRGLDDHVDLARTAAAILDTRADLVALQELDRHMSRSGHVDQPAELADLLGMTIRFVPTLRRGEGEYGMAVATKREDPQNVRLVSLPRLGTEEPRGLLVCSWVGVTVVVTHLSTHRASNDLQLRALAGLAASLPDPTLVLGDFNGDRPARDAFADVGFGGARKRGGTLARVPGRQIDHIFASPSIDIDGVRTIRSNASDHLPLAARLRVT